MAPPRPSPWLTRTNPGHAGYHLNDDPHWIQDVWGVRADAELAQSLLDASGIPLGFPGCDNRIAYGSAKRAQSKQEIRA
ncbi:hypothetical protein H6G65_18020 [Microcystis elabens FACHB-917]|nr:hypothetical protein [Microcystis elabens FACHB-917]